jgi:hypothetical protein
MNHGVKREVRKISSPKMTNECTYILLYTEWEHPHDN